MYFSLGAYSAFGTLPLFPDDFVQQEAGNLREMTALTADYEFQSALCSVHSKTLSQTSFRQSAGAEIRAYLHPRQRCYTENSGKFR